MSEPWYFIVERGAGGRPTASYYYGVLTENLRRKDNRPIYALRLDRLPEDHPWRTRTFAENFGEYLMATEYGYPLPPSNLADPPLPKDPRPRLYGAGYEPLPWHWDWQDKKSEVTDGV